MFSIFQFKRIALPHVKLDAPVTWVCSGMFHPCKSGQLCFPFDAITTVWFGAGLKRNELTVWIGDIGRTIILEVAQPKTAAREKAHKMIINFFIMDPPFLL